jgi:hypothetical protein
MYFFLRIKTKLELQFWPGDRQRRNADTLSDVQKLWKRSPAHSGENFNKHLNWIVSKTFSTKLKRNRIVSSKQFSYLWSQEEISEICQTLLLLTLFWTYFELEFYCCEALSLSPESSFFSLNIFFKTVVNCFF